MTLREIRDVEQELERLAPKGWKFEPNSHHAVCSVRFGPGSAAKFIVAFDRLPETHEERREAEKRHELACAQAKFVAGSPDLIRRLINEIRLLANGYEDPYSAF